MTKLDYFLGVLLIVFGAVLVAGPETHWLVKLLVLVAAVVFVLFVFKLRQERCITCGHFFQRTLAERFKARRRRIRCNDCRIADEAKSVDQSQQTV